MLQKLRDALLKSSISDEIICLLFYGSMKNQIDSHDSSDYDFHLVLKKLNYRTFNILQGILGSLDKIDLSVHELSEIIDNNNTLKFQNGTQGQYFVYVLSHSEILIGTNIYKNFIPMLNEAEVRKSLLFKAKEYLWRLRKMTIDNPSYIIFRKYAVRLIQDMLVYNGDIGYDTLDSISKEKIINIFIKKYSHLITKKEEVEMLQLSNSNQKDNFNFTIVTCVLAKIIP